MPGRGACAAGGSRLLPGSAAPGCGPRTPPSAWGEVGFSLKVTQDNIICSPPPAPLSSLTGHRPYPADKSRYLREETVFVSWFQSVTNWETLESLIDSSGLVSRWAGTRPVVQDFGSLVCFVWGGGGVLIPCECTCCCYCC